MEYSRRDTRIKVSRDRIPLIAQHIDPDRIVVERPVQCPLNARTVFIPLSMPCPEKPFGVRIAGESKHTTIKL